ncbi:hypothetical protein ACA910_006227 [Epithemia clementina (nom. ined.)]
MPNKKDDVNSCLIDEEHEDDGSLIDSSINTEELWNQFESMGPRPVPFSGAKWFDEYCSSIQSTLSEDFMDTLQN